MSLLDGYSGYNQVSVHEDDRDKTTFTTPWGTFHYAKMPFGLKNASATFQCAMDLAFANEKDLFLVVYLDEVTNTLQTDPEGRRGKWIAALLEYDVEIRPTKLVKGQGLAKLMAESNLHALDINLITAMSDENEEGSSIQVSEMFALSPWYSDIIYVLKNLSPLPAMTRNKARTLKLKAAKFCILNYALYWKDPSGILLNCLVEKEAKKVMEDFHEGDCGGHLFWKSTANKVLRAGYYWPTLIADVYKMVKSCHKC
eukprot:PITA_21424